LGVGPLTVDAIIVTVGNGQDFRHGRQMAAWLGLTPAQHFSGGKHRMGAISCRGDRYLRTLLIQSARSSLQRAKVVIPQKATPEQRWIMGLSSRLPFGNPHKAPGL
jgi:transposase